MAAIEPIRISKAYTIAQAARLANTSPNNVRNWLLGSAYPGHRMEPVFGRKDRGDGTLRLSFLELAEIVVVARYRNGQGRTIPLRRLRAAHKYARERMNVQFPFASGRFKEQGGHIIHEFDAQYPGQAIAIDMGGNYLLPVEMEEALDLFDFDESDEELAERWYVAGKNVPIVIDPHFGAGSPVIQGRNVRSSVLVQRWKNGWLIDEIADDFDLEPRVVEAAVNAGVIAAA